MGGEKWGGGREGMKLLPSYYFTYTYKHALGTFIYVFTQNFNHNFTQFTH
jgi:hypothetical protein